MLSALLRPLLIALLIVGVAACGATRKTTDANADRDPLLKKVFLGSQISEGIQIELQAEPLGTLRLYREGVWQDFDPQSDFEKPAVGWVVTLVDPHSGRRVPYGDIFLTLRSTDDKHWEMLVLEPVWARGGFTYFGASQMLPDGDYLAEVSISTPAMNRDQRTGSLWQTAINAAIPFTLTQGLVMSDPQRITEEIADLPPLSTPEFEVSTGYTEAQGLGIELLLESSEAVRTLKSDTWATLLPKEGATTLKVRLTDEVLQSQELPYQSVTVTARHKASGGQLTRELEPTWSNDGLYYSSQAVLPDGEYEFDVEVAQPTFTRRYEYSDYFNAPSKVTFEHSYYVRSQRPSIATRQFFVAVGLFRIPENADLAEAKLRPTGMPLDSDEWVFNGYPVTRVRLGPYASRAEAMLDKTRADRALNQSTVVVSACHAGGELREMQYAVQLGSYEINDYEERIQPALAQLSYASWTVKLQKRGWGLVQVGPFANADDARQARSQLNREFGVQSALLSYCGQVG